MPSGWKLSILNFQLLEFTLLQSFRILSHHELVDTFLDVAIHEGGEIVYGVVDAVVGDAALRIVIGTDFG